MITKVRFFAAIVFLFCTAIWLGAGVYDAISTSITWYQDPILHVMHLNKHSVPGAINPFPIIVGSLTIVNIVTILFFINYQGKGRIELLISFFGTGILLLSTFVYFVPVLANIFENTSAFTNGEIISMSRQWIVVNIIRLAILSACFIAELLGLSKFYMNITKQKEINL